MKKICDCVYFKEGSYCAYWNTTVTLALSKVCRYPALKRIKLKKHIRLTTVLK